VRHHAKVGTGGAAMPVEPLIADGRIFRTRAGGVPWRWRGCSAFKLLALWAAGENVQPFLDAYRGFNILRVWPYVEWGPDESWDVSDAATINAFIADMNRRGFSVELTLLTDDAPARLAWAQAVIPHLTAAAHPGLVLEGGNEPTTHKRIDTPALRPYLEASGYLYASGDYEDSHRFYGTYGVTHTARTFDWPRRAHDLMEFYGGGGPNAPTDPPHKNPWAADEPAKLQDVEIVAADWRAYFGSCALLGAGGTFHSETGKYADLPTDDERRMMAAALEGPDAFAADAANGPYTRIVEQGQPDYGRTYVVGPYMTRCQQPGATPPAGFIPIDVDGVLATAPPAMVTDLRLRTGHRRFRQLLDRLKIRWRED
jgi:hypothetical protein